MNKVYNEIFIKTIKKVIRRNEDIIQLSVKSGLCFYGEAMSSIF